jgi:hypothetical protein
MSWERRARLFAHEVKGLLQLAGPIIVNQLGQIGMHTADTMRSDARLRCSARLPCSSWTARCWPSDGPSPASGVSIVSDPAARG